MSVATEPLITMTPEAVSKLKEFLDEQGTPDQMLRVFVAPGGCSGLQYGMTVEEIAESDDTIIETEGVKLLVEICSRRGQHAADVRF